MWKILGVVGLIAGLLLIAPADVLGQKKNKNNAANKATPEEYTQLQHVKQLAGKLTFIDGTSKTLSIQVDIPHMEPNPKYKPSSNRNLAQLEQRMASLQRQYVNIMNNVRHPAQQQQQLNHLMGQVQQLQAQYARAVNGNVNPNNQPYKVVKNAKEFDLEIEDKVIVRKMFLGTEYDDTGNIKQYTEKQKAELQGTNPARPGYAAKFEDLQTGQEVTLYLTPPAKTSAKKAEKEKGDDGKDAIPEPPARPTVHMIVMTKELNPSLVGNPNPKKK